ncbi:MAG: type I glyceraldehyde-3-phosphate dehydrogenase [Epsilonproteobacteria bacterium]|nr:type I glyceraldehyde-3-phosphate dehydrogenase [Campylobacterota bacterium]
MALKIAINGFGRIGRCVTRIASKRDDVEIVAINDMADIDMMIYLLKNDSVHGVLSNNIYKIDENHISIDKNIIAISNISDPKKLRFVENGADIVLECSGLFLTKEFAQIHIDNGIKKVILSAPTKDDIIPTFVLGVNENLYNAEQIISNASCTTNCLGPIAKILDDNFGIEKGLITTIHSYTNDQNLLDVKHKNDKRRARAAAINMIPTTTGAAKAMNLVLPQLKGKLHGQSVRVPTPDVSMVDLNVVVSKKTTKEELSSIFDKMADTKLKNILLIDKEMRVSQDFVGCNYSCVIADDLTQVIQGDMLKIMAWYDNEWGYSTRLIEMALHINK